MQKTFFLKVLESLESNERSWIATVVHTDGSTPSKVGMRMLISVGTGLYGTIGGGAVEIEVVNRVRKDQPCVPLRWGFDLDSNSGLEKTGMICGGAQEILIEPLFCQNDLYIIGGGHCGQALSELAARCDFRVTVIDDRASVATRENHPFAADVIFARYTEVGKHIHFSNTTCIVVMTHGHHHDGLVVKNVLDRPYQYLGVIGSKKKIKNMFAKLLQEGCDQKKLEKIFAPIGLPIGSDTPMEIAVSVMAQLIKINKSFEVK